MESIGENEPVEAGSGDTKTVAWRNLDNPAAPPNFHVIVQLAEQDECEMLGLTPERIKAIGDQLLSIHKRISEAG
ncbi:hypothetical protein ABIC83_002597 [Roseateles asaccharophilus]|uniref:hypothetical protein n=1 Tax=Roseateles asaccharophilus TaxID=582607 RepID=UPI003835E056